MFIARVVIRRSVVQAPLRDGSATVVVETPNNGTSIHYFLSSVFTARQAAAAVPRALLRVGGQRDLNTTLAASIRDSLQPVPSEQPPRTPVEFSEKFERTEHLIEAFMKKYDSGELVRLGWDSGTSLLCRVHRCSCSQVSAGHDCFHAWSIIPTVLYFYMTVSRIMVAIGIRVLPIKVDNGRKQNILVMDMNVSFVPNHHGRHRCQLPPTSF